MQMRSTCAPAEIETLGDVGEKAVASVDKLIENLKSPSITRRRLATSALGKIGKAAAPAVEALASLAVTDADESVRVSAGSALAKIGQTF